MNKIKQFNSFNPPIIKYSTIFNKYIGKIKARKNKNIFNYGIYGNIIENTLINELKIIEHVKYAIITPSGLYSIFLIYFTLCNKNDYILIPNEIYGPNKNILKIFNKKFNIKTIIYKNNLNIKQFKKYIKKKIKIFFIEAPGSIVFNTTNINILSNYAKQNKIISIIDNSYSASLGFKAHKYNICISIQALTKYQTGTNDILLGCITTNNKRIYKKIKKIYNTLGIQNNQQDCYTTLNSLKTLKIRYLYQSRTCNKLINWIKYLKIIEHIFHPKLKYCNGYKYFNKYFKYSGSIFSLTLKKNIPYYKICNFINHLQLFKIGFSWGGYQNLIMLYKKPYNNYYPKYIIRFYIGLNSIKENLNDIKNNLKYLF